MKRHLPIAALAILLTATLFAAPAAAKLPGFGSFKLSTSISEDLAWSVPAQTVECGTYLGSGRTNFAFKSKKARKITVNSSTIGSPGYIKGGGLQNGTLSVFALPSCMNARDLIQPVSGCGTMSFSPEFSFRPKGRSTYLTSLTGTNAYDDHNFDCAFYGQLSSFPEGGIDSCGVKEDGLREIYNQALRDIGGEGITSVKFPFSAKTLLKIKKGKSKTYKKQFAIKCTVATERGFNVVFDGKLKATVTFKRVG